MLVIPTLHREAQCHYIRQAIEYCPDYIKVFFFFVFLGLNLWHMEVPTLGGLIGAVAASLHHSHSNARSEPCMETTPQITETLDH